MQKFIEDVLDYQRNCVMILEGEEKIKDRIIFHQSDEINKEEYFQFDLKGLGIENIYIIRHKCSDRIPGDDVSSITFMRESRDVNIKYKRCGFTKISTDDKTTCYEIKLIENDLYIIGSLTPNFDGMNTLDQEVEFPIIEYHLSGCTYDMKVFFDENEYSKYFVIHGRRYSNQENTISHFLTMRNYFKDSYNKGFLNDLFSGEYDNIIIEINNNGEYSIGISPYRVGLNGIVIVIDEKDMFIDYDTFFRSIATNIWTITLFKSSKKIEEANAENFELDIDNLPEGLIDILGKNGIELEDDTEE